MTSALVIGTFAPDLEYFIRLTSGGGWGHTLAGAFGMDLPLGLAVLWLFHRLVKVPLISLLPDGLRARLGKYPGPFRWGPPRRFALILLSLLVGIATHLVWDGFTHPQYWIVQHWTLLDHVHYYPGLGWMANCAVLQSVTSAAGLALLVAWCAWWYRGTAPDPEIGPSSFSPGQRIWLVVLICASAGVGGVARAYWSVGFPDNRIAAGDFAQQAIVTASTLAWWQLALWGLLGPFRTAHRRKAALDRV